MTTGGKRSGKLYYSIGEVSSMFDVNSSAIRFYEKEFDVIKPHRNKKGNRFFTPSDVDYFKIIFHLIKEKGYTLARVKGMIKDFSMENILEGATENTHASSSKDSGKKSPESENDSIEPPKEEIIKRLRRVRELLEKMDKDLV